MKRKKRTRLNAHWACLAGNKGAGKDTFADFFVELGYTKVAFGDNLKSMISYAFQMDNVYFYDPNIKDRKFDSPIYISKQNIDKLNEWISKTHVFEIPYTYENIELESPRHMMQYIGTDIIRTLYQPYHVEATIRKMVDLPYMICSDVRFLNELEGIQKEAKRLGIDLHTIYIERKGFVGDNHISENSVKKEDFAVTVENNSNLQSLKQLSRLFTRKER